MKRSEAIKKLMFRLNLYEVLTQDKYESGFYYDRANRFLIFLEKELGMLPPTIKLTKSVFPGDSYEYEVNEWDEE